VEIPARYRPADVEPRVFAGWEQTGGFGADARSPRPSYVIALPLPNVTGELHMGHALNGSIQDALIRLHRMRGCEALWICGTDHASIAVHAVMERQLRAEGLSRFDLGRDAFLERVWDWRHRTSATIIGQFKRLGCSLDYENERFTMDDGYVRAVLEVFVALYRKGLIYRDNRIVNWCPSCASTISDLEVRYEHAHDTLYEVRYSIAGTNETVSVATVRPETILADTAVAVHPDDERYRHLVGRTAIVPLVDREVPIIADEYVKRDFGTGVLKITPGHDPNDFEIGRRHGLPELTAIGFDGLMTELAGEYAGLTAAEARERIRNDLFAQDRLRAEHDYEHEVGHCDRTGDRIEPLVSLQWFMRMDELAARANAEVRSGRVRFHPKSRENIYFDWMENIRPWCISRQLWWGHQIPVWYCADGHETCALEPPAACATCGKEQLERDQDVLDTWFSSALWPFATLGWPERTERLRAFYPGNALVTARDIINLWVARMLMMGLEFMGEVPFDDVVITSTIQAPDGRRMSKSLGTGINPLDLIDRYSADATRYGLLKMSSTQDVRFAEGMIDEGSRFANKLWNAARFVLLQADLEAPAEPAREELVDRWICSRLAGAQRDVLRLLDAFDFAGAVKALYAFVWNDFCDWYVEAAKLRLYGEDAGARTAVSGTLLFALERILALVHPICPFVSEAIWALLPGERGMLMRSHMPDPVEAHLDAGAEAEMHELMEVVGQLRDDPEGRLRVLDGYPYGGLVRHLTRRDVVIQVAAPAAAVATSPPAAVVVGDPERLARQLETAAAELERARRMLANERFVAKAPASLVEEERQKAERFAARVAELEARLAASA
jgi:valyl-tRNA synthetase